MLHKDTMFRKAKIRIAALLGVLLLFSHCYVVSEFIVGGEGAVFVDDRLAGLWRFPGKSGYMLIARHKSGDFSFQYFTGNFEMDSEYFAGKLSRLSGKTFFNVKRYNAMGERAADPGYIPAFYDLQGDKLKIALFETKFFNDAIGAKKLAGQIPMQSSTYSTAPTRISSRGEDLGKFILENFEKPGLFDNVQVMERIKVELPKENPEGVIPK